MSQDVILLMISGVTMSLILVYILRTRAADKAWQDSDVEYQTWQARTRTLRLFGGVAVGVSIALGAIGSGWAKAASLLLMGSVFIVCGSCFLMRPEAVRQFFEATWPPHQRVGPVPKGRVRFTIPDLTIWGLFYAQWTFIILWGLGAVAAGGALAWQGAHSLATILLGSHA